MTEHTMSQWAEIYSKKDKKIIKKIYKLILKRDILNSRIKIETNKLTNNTTIDQVETL